MTNTLPRFIPAGFVQYKPTLNGYENGLFACYVNRGSDKSQAIFYIGKQKKHAWFFNFRNDEDMKKKINESISSLMAWEDKKLERKEARKTRTAGVEVGQIYAYSWGYDQTNVDFFQVTEVKGKTFTIREIRGKMVEDNGFTSMSGKCVPVRDAFREKEEPKLKRSFRMDHGSLELTNETKAHYVSWTA